MPRAVAPAGRGLLAALALAPGSARAACALSGPAGSTLLQADTGGLPLAWISAGTILVLAAGLALAVRHRAVRVAAVVAALAVPVAGDGGNAPSVMELACGGSRHYVAYSDGTERLLPASGDGLELIVPAGIGFTLRTLGRGHRPGPLERFLGLSRPALPAVAAEHRLAPATAGHYQGQCPSLCPGRSNPATHLRVLERGAFQAWREDSSGLAPAHSRRPREELMNLGEQVYRRRCAACHGSRGQGVTGVYPGLRHSAMVRGPIEPHLLFQYYGRPGSPMKAFGEELTPVELAAVTTYQRNALGHDTGDTVQPWMVELIRASGAGD